MIVCSVNNVTKSYEGTRIFEGFSLELRKGERVGLIGRNGSGKTTLMKCLSRTEEVEAGQIHWSKGCRIGYLAQIPNYKKGTLTKAILRLAFDALIEIEQEMKTLEEQMGEIEADHLQKVMDTYGKLQERFVSEGGYEIDAAIQRVTRGLNIQSLLDQEFERLSGGEQTKVGLALNLLKQPDLLLLDEPTNHLDIESREVLEEALQEFDGTILGVSHDRYFLDKLFQKVYWIESQRVMEFAGDYAWAKKKMDELRNETVSE